MFERNVNFGLFKDYYYLAIFLKKFKENFLLKKLTKETSDYRKKFFRKYSIINLP